MSNLGDPEGATRSFRKAQALVESRASRADASVPDVSAYVDASRFLSQTLVSVGQRAQAVTAARDAVTIAERFAARHPSLDTAKELLAAGHVSAAVAAEQPDALRHWQGALAAYESLLAERPNDPDQQGNVATSQRTWVVRRKPAHNQIGVLAAPLPP